MHHLMMCSGALDFIDGHQVCENPTNLSCWDAHPEGVP